MSATPKIRAVVFDVGGVLAANLRWYEGWSEGLIDADRAGAVEQRRAAFWTRMREDPGQSEEAFWRAVLDEAGLQERVDVATCKAAIRKPWRPFYSTLALAERLRGRGIEIAICSNHAREWFDEMTQRFCFAHVFRNTDLIVASYAVACSKPSHAIFDVVMARLAGHLPDLQRSEVVLVDDQRKNTSSAEAYGWHAILFDADVEAPTTLVEKLSSLGVDAAEISISESNH